MTPKEAAEWLIAYGLDRVRDAKVHVSIRTILTQGYAPEGKVIVDAPEPERALTFEEELQLVLNGEVELLWEAFRWDETAEGHEFWHEQAEANKLTQEGEAAIRAMLSAAEKGVTSICANAQNDVVHIQSHTEKETGQ